MSEIIRRASGKSAPAKKATPADSTKGSPKPR
jgi:hypothetical protein